MADGMHRQLRHFFALLLYGLLNHQRFALFVQITALGGDVERVLEFAHGGFSLFDRTFVMVVFLINNGIKIQNQCKSTV